MYSFFDICQKLKRCGKVHFFPRGPPFGSSIQKISEWRAEKKMKDIKYIIADNVRLYRKRENLTQMELAELAELSLDSIKRLEGGKRTMSLDNFLRVADALHIPMSYLLYEKWEEAPETERIKEIMQGKNLSQREYLLHILSEMAKEMDKLL